MTEPSDTTTAPGYALVSGARTLDTMKAEALAVYEDVTNRLADARSRRKDIDAMIRDLVEQQRTAERVYSSFTPKTRTRKPKDDKS